MSDEFRELLKRVGSGTHTSRNLSRNEAKKATTMMLLQQATPAQIGAFMIAHRIKRPNPEELAGILDAFDQLGSHLNICPQHHHEPVVLGNPYDGRSRTVPVSVITALILAAVDIPVIMHGGKLMPTKYGMPLIDIWRKLGADFSKFDLAQAQNIYDQTQIGFIYLPRHFSVAHDFVVYREQIGKRPPFATAELAWCPVVPHCSVVSGFVHPPTEERFRATFKLRQTQEFTLVKGLEGSCDLSRNRTGIITIGTSSQYFERMLLNPADYDLNGSDIALESNEQALDLIQGVITGTQNKLFSAAILNGGFYLWRFKLTSSLESAFELATAILTEGKVAAKLKQLQTFCL